MIINVSYPIAALHEASKFIWENNSKVKDWPSKPKDIFDVMKNIQNAVRKGALSNAKAIIKEKQHKADFNGEWCNYDGTGGYYILYELYEYTDEQITIGVTILIDPAVDVPAKGFVTEVIDTIVPIV